MRTTNRLFSLFFAMLPGFVDSHGHAVMGGAKLTIDGSPQGFTAYRDRPRHQE